MNNWLLLFRGINVGGNNLVPMKKLTEVLISMGCAEVNTYIQSGNVLIEHQENDQTKLSAKIAEEVEKFFGFKPQVLVLSLDEFTQAARQNPFPNAGLEPKNLHLFFLSQAVQSVDLNDLFLLKKPSESFELIDQVFYLHAPEGIGRSKLAAKVEKHLGVAITARNWNTVQKLLGLAGIA
jgi:uncharacterized protein (DUF1697 family)